MGLEYIVCATIMIFTAMIIMIKIMIILIIVVIIMLEICHNFDDSPAMLRFKIWAQNLTEDWFYKDQGSLGEVS